ncbi:sensor histidine kinase [Sphingomonas sp. PR090111-T3T-6A]|uniref:sensor histidine kinase n=1 Tax=Sphingomonas sp. PR090111-T3T-6A TaxID=685778 RepID=UPI000367F6E0|nr:PAS domain S-box protein [Sphingomonas sp. PR090111-T3T-6A]
MDGTGGDGALEILDLVHDSIIIRALDGTILQWNAAAEAQYGWSRAEALTRRLDELLPCRSPEHLEQIKAELFSHGVWAGELVRRDRHGRDRRIEVRWSIERGEDGTPRRIIETGRDVTEQHANEEAVRLSEYRFRNLFEAMAVSFWEIDFNAVGAMFLPLRDQGVADLRSYLATRPAFVREMMEATRVLDVNAKTLEMFGAAAKDEIVGHGTARYWPEENYPVFVDSLVATLEKQPSFVRETALIDHHGNRLDVMFTVAWSPDTRKRGVVTLGVLDITDRLNAERRLQQIQADYIHAARVATLGELTASIAHEVNQPLAAIATNGEASLRWLSRAEPNVGEARELASRMVADARRAADVIRHIRSMATRQSAGRERLAVGDVIAETLDFLRRDLHAHDVRVTFDAAPRIPLIDGNRTELQQVLINLAVNAQQAMGQHGVQDRRLTIRATAPAGGGVAVEIEDSGPGIPPDLADRLFDSFVTTKPNGLGIGLSICRTIIEAHGGHIAADNGRTGARFTFTLPAAEPPFLP